MKSIKWTGITIIFAVFGFGCANPVYVQKDESASLAKMRTYAWVETKRNQDDNKQRSADFAELGIHNAVNKELSKRGWQEVTTNPDVMLSYDILVEKTTQQTSSPVYSQPFTRVYYNPYFHRWGTIYYPSQFWGYETMETPVREGTVTVTMMDPNSDKTIWQAWTTETMQNRRISDAELSKAAHDIFKKFDTSK